MKVGNGGKKGGTEECSGTEGKLGKKGKKQSGSGYILSTVKEERETEQIDTHKSSIL